MNESFEKFYLADDDYGDGFHEGYLAGCRDSATDNYRLATLKEIPSETPNGETRVAVLRWVVPIEDEDE